MSADACIAIEDTPAGIASAAGAGMTTIAVPHRLTAATDLSRADVVVADLRAASAVVERWSRGARGVIRRGPATRALEHTR